MRSFLAIFVASLYLAFSVGISIEVHQCNEANGIQDFISQNTLQKDNACKAADQHACCTAEKESSCCADKAESKDDCCVDEHMLIHLDEEQLVSKNQILTFFTTDTNTLPSDRISLLKEEALIKEHYVQPPPIKDDRHIRFCSLTFYG